MCRRDPPDVLTRNDRLRRRKHGGLGLKPVHAIAYVSRIAPGVDRSAIDRIVERAEVNNQHSGVTGVLLAGGGHFLQTIEGSELIVRSVFERIQEDDRHTDLRVLIRSDLPRRLFPNWSMGLMDLSHEGSVDSGRLEGILIGIELARPTAPASLRIVSILRDFAKQLRTRPESHPGERAA